VLAGIEMALSIEKDVGLESRRQRAGEFLHAWLSSLS